MARVKLMVMAFGAFWAMLFLTLYMWKVWGYRHPQNPVAQSVVAVS